MKLLATLLLSLAVSTALAHGNHDDETFVPLKPGAQAKPAPGPAAEPQKKAEKSTKKKVAKKTADAATPPADAPAAATPTP